MTWVKLDDRFPFNQKAVLAGKDGRALYITALCYTSEQLTDGHIRTGLVPMLAAIAEVENGEATAARLVEVGLWHHSDGGYQIHDYLEYNPSAEKVKQEREDAKARMKAVRENQQRNSDGTFGRSSGEQQANREQTSSDVTPSPFPYPSPVLTTHTPSECGASATPATAGPTAPSDPLSDCIAYLNQPKANKPGAIGRLYSIRYGARYPPDYARLGALAKQLSGSYTALAELIWRSTVPDGDPHDYLQGCVNGTPARKGSTRKDGSNGRTSIADSRHASDHNREPNAAELAAYNEHMERLRQQSAGEAPPAG